MRDTPTRAAPDMAWAFDGDVLVVRIPVGRFARQMALKALAGI
jgi:hypothetical protein